ncbi:MAG: CarD family transcriptional regulator [Ruminococcaceae bacterium]|nr:CarD family transcriptional regulator [Oscillospiraceae bacterium]
MTFRVGDRIAHPMHGAGVIDKIIKKRINGEERDYYVLKLPAGDMLVMIPVDGCEQIGVRHIIDSKAAETIMDSISDIEISMNQNWHKRYRENMLKIKSGDLMEVAEVVKGLIISDDEKGLSMQDRKILNAAKQILISEIVLSSSFSYDEVEQRIHKSVNLS